MSKSVENKAIYAAACPGIEHALVGDRRSVDVTAFPSAAGKGGWLAAEALIRNLACDAQANAVTTSSVGGGPLMARNDEGPTLNRGIATPVGRPETQQAPLNREPSLEAGLTTSTLNVAELSRLPHKDWTAVDTDADRSTFAITHYTAQLTRVMINGVWHRDEHERVIHGRAERQH